MLINIVFVWGVRGGGRGPGQCIDKTSNLIILTRIIDLLFLLPLLLHLTSSHFPIIITENYTLIYTKFYPVMLKNNN